MRILSIAILVIPLQLFAAGSLSRQEVDQYMGVAGAVIASKQTTESVMMTCGRLVPDLAAQARSASQSWNRRNKGLVTQARALKAKVVRHLQAIGDHARVQMFLGQLKRYMATEVRTSIAAISRLRPVERKYVCLQLITKIKNGQWDVQAASPAAFHFMKSIKQKR